MSIVYVHGVANRDDDPSYKPHLKEISDFLDRYVGSDLSPSRKVFNAYWGKFGAAFAWDRESRPKTVLRGQGAAQQTSSSLDRALVLASIDGTEIPAAPAASQPSSVLVPSGPAIGSAPLGLGVRLKDLSPDDLSDLLSTVIVEGTTDPGARPQMIIAAETPNLPGWSPPQTSRSSLRTRKD